MKKFLCIFLVTLIILNPVSNVYADSLSLKADAAVVIDGESGEVLYDKQMHKLKFPASTTKIMTAILTLENCNLNDVVTIDAQTPFSDGNRIYLVEGEHITINNLLYALLLDSANDAAVALAKNISGNVDDFAKLMNEKAKEVGALNTNFHNPNGLPDNQHVTTAYDLAMIARYAMKNPEFRKVVGTYQYTIPATDKQPNRYLYNHNKLLWSHEKVFYKNQWRTVKYEGATGIKTGYTIAAGSCVVASAKIGGRELVAVVLQSDPKDQYLDVIKLFGYGFANYKNIVLVKKGEIAGKVRVNSGTSSFVNAVAEDNFTVTVPKDFDEKTIRKQVDLSTKLKAPIKKGQVIGTVKIYSDDKLLKEYPLKAAKDIKKSALLKFLAALLLKIAAGLVACILIIYLTLIIYWNFRRKKRRMFSRKRY